MTLQVLYSNFHIYEKNFILFFISVHSGPANFHSTRLKMLMTDPSHQLGILWSQWLYCRLIKINAKCRYEKNWPVERLCGRCFICLRPPLLLWPHIPIKEKVRGAIVHKAGRKYQHDWLYLQSIKTLPGREYFWNFTMSRNHPLLIREKAPETETFPTRKNKLS
jgi:hypothetical protein